MKLLRETVGACRGRLPQLVATDLLFKVVSAMLLGPLYAATLRLAVAASGEELLTDLDLLFFVVSPIGWAALLLLLVVGIAIAAMQVATLLVVLASPRDQPAPVVGALRYAFVRGEAVLRVAARIAIELLLWLAPIAVAGAVAYRLLLGEHDINFYLSERPREFLLAIAIAAVLVVAALVVIARIVFRWFLALPIVLFETLPPSGVGGESQRRLLGHRRRVLAAIAAVFFLSTLLGAAAAGLPLWLLDRLVPIVKSSLPMIAAVSGVCLTLAILGGVAANLIGNLLFAALLDRWHRRTGGDPEESVAQHLKRFSFDDRLESLVTRKRVVAALLVGAVASVTLGYTVLASLPTEDRVKVIGHRGAPEAAPENTLASVEAAIAEGADWVEIDVQELADGTVAVFHDSDFMKAAGEDLKIWDATPDDLRRIDIGSRFSAEFSDQRVPTLGRVLDACRDRAGLLVELKYYGHDEQLERRVVELVERHGMVGQTEFMSLEKSGVAKLKALRPGWRAGVLMTVAIGNTEKIDAEFVAINAAAATRVRIDQWHARDKDVYVWTVNDPLEMSSLVSRGVDGLITDRPGLARRVLREREGMTPVQRLLVELAALFD